MTGNKLIRREVIALRDTEEKTKKKKGKEKGMKKIGTPLGTSNSKTKNEQDEAGVGSEKEWEVLFLFKPFSLSNYE